MKIVKSILYVILAIVALLLIASLILPKDYMVERSIVINAPADLIRQQAVHWSNFHEWSPWSKLDPDMKLEFQGEEGTVGSSYTWEGNKEAGKGKQEIVAISENQVDIQLNFEEPFESEALTYFIFNDVEEGTEVIWGMKSRMPWPFNVMTFMFKGAIGNDYEEGLASLKERCENLSAESVIDGYYIQQMNLPYRVYVGRRSTLKFEKISEFMENTIPGAMAAVMQSGQDPVGKPSGLFFTWDEEKMESDAFFGIPVERDPNVAGFVSIPISGIAYYIDYFGPYGDSGGAHEAMDKFLKKNNIANVDVAIEEYLTDTTFESDPSKWHTRIMYVSKQ